jgi:hypothetical protein
MRSDQPPGRPLRVTRGSREEQEGPGNIPTRCLVVLSLALYPANGAPTGQRANLSHLSACPLTNAIFRRFVSRRAKPRRCSSTYRVRQGECCGSAGRAWDGGGVERAKDAALACDGGGGGKQRDRTVGQADREVPARGCEGNRVRVNAPVSEVEEAASVRAGRRLPEANGAVPGPGNDPIPRRVEGNPQHVLGMAGEGSFLFGSEAPEAKWAGASQTAASVFESGLNARPVKWVSPWNLCSAGRWPARPPARPSGRRRPTSDRRG